MKLSLLEMTQAVLNDMDADEVTSITDTFEAEQVAAIVRDSYFFLINDRNWPHTKEFSDLSALSTPTPVHLEVGDKVKEIIYIKYDKRDNGETRRKYKDVYYMHPEYFLDWTNRRNNDNSNVEIVTNVDTDTSGLITVNTELLIMNDRHPTYFTSFNDKVLVFDAYDSDKGSALDPDDFQLYAYVIPTWIHQDSFDMDLPEEAMQLLLEESKSTASYKLKQMVDEKAEARSKKADTWLSQKAFVVKGGIRMPNYGRRRSRHNAYRRTPLDKDN